MKYYNEEWKLGEFVYVFKYIYDIKKSILNKIIYRFQYLTVMRWNPYIKHVCKTIVPRVFMYDEMTTNGYGICIIEMILLDSILIKIEIEQDRHKWILEPN